MTKNTSETLKLLMKIIKLGKSLISLVIFIGLGLFSIYTFLIFLIFIINDKINYYDLLMIIFISLIISTLSFIVHRIFPNNFSIWDIKKTKHLLEQKYLGIAKTEVVSNFILTTFFFSPLANLIKSIGLSFFILSLLNPNITLLWHQVFVSHRYMLDGDEIYGYFAFCLNIIITIFASIIIFIIIFYLIITFFNAFVHFLKIDNILKKIMPVIFFYLAVMIFGYLQVMSVLIFYPFLLPFSTKLVVFIIGSIPLGWFYELFIVPFLSKDITDKLFNKSKPIKDSNI